MIILSKSKIFIKNYKLNLNSILNLKFKLYNININFLYKNIMQYINKYKINIFIIYIYSDKSFKIICNYTIYYLYKKYNYIFNKINIIYKILLYKKLQLIFYNIYQLINIIQFTLKILKNK
nr:hypothetical protein [Haemoproteus belopolskyi]